MIKIYEKLWFIKGRDKGNLSYMCQFETIEGGEIAPNIKGMQSTGRRWAKKIMIRILELLLIIFQLKIST